MAKRAHLSSHLIPKEGKSLLEQAKELKPNRSYSRTELTEDNLELVTAWLNDDIALEQVTKVLKLGSGNGYSFLARGAKELYRRSLKE